MPEDTIPEVQAEAVRFYNELGDQQLTTELYFVKHYGEGSTRAGIQIKVVCINDKLIWVATEARKRGYQVSAEDEGLLINIL